MLFLPGTPRIKLLNVAGTPVLYLPMPDEGYPTLEFAEKGQLENLVDGSEAWRQLGWIPVLTLRWDIYDDRSTEGYVIGTANGNRPAMTDLLTILSGAPNSFSISPGPSAGGFTVGSWKVSPIGVMPGGFAKGLEVKFRGGPIQATQTLGAF